MRELARSLHRLTGTVSGRAATFRGGLRRGSQGAVTGSRLGTRWSSGRRGWRPAVFEEQGESLRTVCRAPVDWILRHQLPCSQYPK